MWRERGRAKGNHLRDRTQSGLSSLYDSSNTPNTPRKQYRPAKGGGAWIVAEQRSVAVAVDGALLDKPISSLDVRVERYLLWLGYHVKCSSRSWLSAIWSLSNSTRRRLYIDIMTSHAGHDMSGMDGTSTGSTAAHMSMQVESALPLSSWITL